jgi:hypothetical protein
MTDKKYLEELEAHLDAGGNITVVNVRDLIRMIQEESSRCDKLTTVLKNAWEFLNKDTPIRAFGFLHQDIMVALENVGAIEKIRKVEI